MSFDFSLEAFKESQISDSPLPFPDPPSHFPFDFSAPPLFPLEEPSQEKDDSITSEIERLEKEASKTLIYTVSHTLMANFAGLPDFANTFLDKEPLEGESSQAYVYFQKVIEHLRGKNQGPQKAILDHFAQQMTQLLEVEAIGDWLRTNKTSLKNSPEKLFAVWVTGKIAALKTGESLLIPAGWKTSRYDGHSMLLEITKNSEDSYNVVVCNTGEGSRHHPSALKNHKYQHDEFLHVSKVHPSKILRNAPWMGFYAMMYSWDANSPYISKSQEDETFSIFYQRFLDSLICGNFIKKALYQKSKSPPTLSDYRRDQVVGNCVVDVLFAYFKHQCKKADQLGLYWELRDLSRIMLLDEYYAKLQSTDGIFSSIEDTPLHSKRSQYAHRTGVILFLEQCVKRVAKGLVKAIQLKRIAEKEIQPSFKLISDIAGKIHTIKQVWAKNISHSPSIPAFFLRGSSDHVANVDKIAEPIKQSSLAQTPHWILSERLPPYKGLAKAEKPWVVIQAWIQEITEAFQKSSGSDELLLLHCEAIFRELPPCNSDYWKRLRLEECPTWMEAISALSNIYLRLYPSSLQATGFTTTATYLLKGLSIQTTLAAKDPWTSTLQFKLGYLPFSINKDHFIGMNPLFFETNAAVARDLEIALNGLSGCLEKTEIDHSLQLCKLNLGSGMFASIPQDEQISSSSIKMMKKQSKEASAPVKHSSERSFLKHYLFDESNTKILKSISTQLASQLSVDANSVPIHALIAAAAADLQGKSISPIYAHLKKQALLTALFFTHQVTRKLTNKSNSRTNPEVLSTELAHNCDREVSTLFWTTRGFFYSRSRSGIPILHDVYYPRAIRNDELHASEELPLGLIESSLLTRPLTTHNQVMLSDKGPNSLISQSLSNKTTRIDRIPESSIPHLKTKRHFLCRQAPVQQIFNLLEWYEARPDLLSDPFEQIIFESVLFNPGCLQKAIEESPECVHPLNSFIAKGFQETELLRGKLFYLMLGEKFQAFLDQNEKAKKEIGRSFEFLKLSHRFESLWNQPISSSDRSEIAAAFLEIHGEGRPINNLDESLRLLQCSCWLAENPQRKQSRWHLGHGVIKGRFALATFLSRLSEEDKKLLQERLSVFAHHHLKLTGKPKILFWELRNFPIATAQMDKQGNVISIDLHTGQIFINDLQTSQFLPPKAVPYILDPFPPPESLRNIRVGKSWVEFEDHLGKSKVLFSDNQGKMLRELPAKVGSGKELTVGCDVEMQKNMVEIFGEAILAKSSPWIGPATIHFLNRKTGETLYHFDRASRLLISNAGQTKGLYKINLQKENPFHRLMNAFDPHILFWGNKIGQVTTIESPSSGLFFDVTYPAPSKIEISAFVNNNRLILEMADLPSLTKLDGYLLFHDLSGNKHVLIPHQTAKSSNDYASLLSFLPRDIPFEKPHPLYIYKVNEQGELNSQHREERLYLAYLYIGMRDYSRAYKILCHSYFIEKPGPYNETELQLLLQIAGAFFYDAEDLFTDNSLAACALRLRAFHWFSVNKDQWKESLNFTLEQALKKYNNHRFPADLRLYQDQFSHVPAEMRLPEFLIQKYAPPPKHGGQKNGGLIPFFQLGKEFQAPIARPLSADQIISHYQKKGISFLLQHFLALYEIARKGSASEREEIAAGMAWIKFPESSLGLASILQGCAISKDLTHWPTVESLKPLFEKENHFGSSVFSSSSSSIQLNFPPSDISFSVPAPFNPLSSLDFNSSPPQAFPSLLDSPDCSPTRVSLSSIVLNQDDLSGTNLRQTFEQMKKLADEELVRPVPSFNDFNTDERSWFLTPLLQRESSSSQPTKIIFSREQNRDRWNQHLDSIQTKFSTFFAPLSESDKKESNSQVESEIKASIQAFAERSKKIITSLDSSVAQEILERAVISAQKALSHRESRLSVEPWAQLNPAAIPQLKRYLTAELESCSKILQGLQEELYRLAKIERVQPDHPFRTMRRLAGYEPPITFDELPLLYLQNDPSFYHERDPLISVEDGSNLIAATEEYLLHLAWNKQLERANRALQAIDELSHPDQTLNEDERNDQYRIIYESLTARRMYNPELMPECLVYEATQGLMMRGDQIKAYFDFTNGKNGIQQLIMGSGKSEVLLPLIALKFANGKKLSVVMLFQDLIDSVADQIQRNAGSIFGQSLKRINWKGFLEKSLSLGQLKILKKQLIDIIKSRHVLIMSHMDKHYFDLQFLQALIDYQKHPTTEGKKKLKKFIQIEEIFKRHGNLLIDEVDSCLKTTFEVQKAIGTPKPISQFYIDITVVVYKQLLRLQGQFHFDCMGSDRISGSKLFDPATDWKEISYKIEQDVLKYLVKCGFIQENQVETIRQYINGKTELTVSFSKEQKDTLAVLKLLLTTVLQTTLGNLHGDRYALSKIPGKKNRLAIPHDKTHPRNFSQFALTEEQLAYTIQSYFREGVSPEQIKDVVQECLTAAKVQRLSAQGNLLENTQAYKKFAQLFGNEFAKRMLSLKQADFELIAQRLHKDKNQLLDFLKDFVLPKIQRYDSKIISTAQSMPSSFKHVIGMSGTVDSEKAVFSDQFNGNVTLDDRIDGLVIAALLKQQGKTPVTVIKEARNALETLQAILSKDTEDACRAIIDAGSLLLGSSPKQLAEHVLHLKPSLKAVVYYDIDKEGQSRLWILKRSLKDPQLYDPQLPCSIPSHERFTIYDSQHCTGANIPQSAGAKAFLTINQTLQFRDLAQAAYRMRKILQGQQVMFVMEQDVAKLVMANVGNKSKFEGLCNADVILFTLIQQALRQEELHIKAVRQKMMAALREACLPILQSVAKDDLRLEQSRLVSPYFQSLSSLLISIMQDEPYLQYTSVGNQEDASLVLDHYRNGILKKLQEWEKTAAVHLTLSEMACYTQSLTQLKSRLDQIVKMAKPIVARKLPASLDIQMGQEVSVEISQDQEQNHQMNLELMEETIEFITDPEFIIADRCYWTPSFNQLKPIRRQDGQLINVAESFQTPMLSNSDGFVPVLSITDALQTSKTHAKVAAYRWFSPLLFGTLNMLFATDKGDPFDCNLKPRHYYLIFQEKGSSKPVSQIVLIDDADARDWKSFLANDRRSVGGDVSSRFYRISLNHFHSGVNQQGCDPITLESLKSDRQFQINLVQAKFLAGLLSYTEQEQVLLNEWLSSLKSESPLIETFFKEHLLAKEPMMEAAYESSVLNHIFRAIIKS